MKNIFILFIAIFISCNRIESGNELSKSDLTRIKSLYDLDSDESVINFYSEFKNSVAGNFYTDKRIASYWIDEQDESKNKINSAYFNQITQIDTVIYAGVTYSPHLLITKANNSTFKVCFDGEISDLRKIFSDVLNRWKSSPKNSKKNLNNDTKLSCYLDHLLNSSTVPKLAKDIYLDNDWNLSNDNEALALLDSLNAKNKTSRPFYFKVVTKTYKKSDGYFSEGLGLAGKEYIENNTKEFISNFDIKDCFTDNDLTTWAKIVILEFSISGEGEYDKPIVDDYIKKLKSNCKDCSPTQKENINKFGLTLRNEWKEFLKHID